MQSLKYSWTFFHLELFSRYWKFGDFTLRIIIEKLLISFKWLKLSSPDTLFPSHLRYFYILFLEPERWVLFGCNYIPSTRPMVLLESSPLRRHFFPVLKQCTVIQPLCRHSFASWGKGNPVQAGPSAIVSGLSRQIMWTCILYGDLPLFGVGAFSNYRMAPPKYISFLIGSLRKPGIGP